MPQFRLPVLRRILLFLLLVVISIFGLNNGTRPAQAAANDNNVESDGVFADQGPQYMSPLEPSATDQVVVRLRVFKGDITSANVKYYDTADSTYKWVPMYWERNDPLGTFDLWQAVIPASPSLKYYRYQINDGTSTVWYNAQGIWPNEPNGGDFWIVPGFHTPDWSKKAIYYQIFPDRFNDGDPSNNLTFTSSSAVSPTNGACPAGSYLYGGECAYQHTSWAELPQNPTVNGDFFGGDLSGIIAKIDPYLKGQLGVNALYLNPIFKSPSIHKYDTEDYSQVDPHFGTNADLQTLVSAAHGGTSRMSVILDGVFNHTSDYSVWFDSQHKYATDGASESQTSQWSDRYVFLNWPASYCDWAGYASLPKLNYASSALRDDIYRSANSVMQTYLKAPYNIDGWRYDVAGDLVSITSTPNAGGCGGTNDHTLWQEIRPYVKGVNPEALMMGEEWGNPNAWMNGKEWDSAMNYNGFNIPISKWIDCSHVHGEEAGQCLSVTAFDGWLRGTLADNPRPVQLTLMNSLSTHDTSRFLWRSGGDEWKMKLGIIVQMTYVGAPSIYYGDEVGLTGNNDPDNRRTFNWDTSSWNTNILNLYKTLIQTRKDVSAFTDGSFKTLLINDTNKLYSYGRWDDRSWAIVVLNNDSVGHDAAVPAWQLSIPDGTVLTDKLTGNTYTVTNGSVSVPASALLGHYGVVLVATPDNGTGLGTPTPAPTPTGQPTFAPPTNTPAPTGPSSVTIAGSLQTALGCANNWDPSCTASGLTYDAADQVWQGTFNVPAGSYEYKAALNGTWDVNYGANATQNGGNIALNMASAGSVKFYYDDATHWITSNQNAVIVTAPGSYQNRIGCPGDWQPDCLRSWLEDTDGDGIYTRTVTLPAGGYEVKAAINEGWTENYGANGAANGANIAFTVATNGSPVTFSYNATTHVLTVSVAGSTPDAPTPTATPSNGQPSKVVVPGSMQSEVGCPGDWQPDCNSTALTFDTTDQIWQGTFNIPAGTYEYKAALNGTWDVNYGVNATAGGANIPLTLPADSAVKFYYDNDTHWITSNKNAVIATVAGSFQSEIGCPGDWQPDCLRSWLEDPNGDGIYTRTVTLPAGSYEAKVAINEGWTENYGSGGTPGGSNIPFTVTSNNTDVFFSYDSTSHILTINVGGAPKGDLSLARAHWVSRDTIAWNVPNAASNTYKLYYNPNGGLSLETSGVVGGTELSLTYDPAGLPDAIKQKFPYIANFSALKLSAADAANVSDILKGQIAISATGSDGKLVDATSLQIPGVLDDLYTYSGSLGILYNNSAPSLNLWSPTAKSVTLKLYADSNPATTSTDYPMTLDPATGVWSVTGSPDWNYKYYLYDVEVYVRSTGKVEHNLVTDPYSVSLSMNSTRSQIVNLADPSLMPANWSSMQKPPLVAPEDIVLYELHIRDFSAYDQTVPAEYRGTYKAFTVPAGSGMKHLTELAKAGLTHVHLLPAFDIATINEDKTQRTEPDPAVLASYPPDSDQQAAAVDAVKDKDAFNWGYDPYHYGVPEGSYSTNPDGTTRIVEFREMVQALNNAGLRVVMDVVYNHTDASGQNNYSVLDKIVPGYYQRLNLDGNVETSTCCQNTASEHSMMEKLMIDTMKTWATAYKVDGFRFDLMGHHMKSNLINIKNALNSLTVANDGVDGSKIYLYGEGWDFGEVAKNARGVNATQLNMAGTGIGTFSDRLRDGVRGGGPFSGLQEQGFINGLYYDPNSTNQGTTDEQKAKLLHYSDWIRVGLAGNLANYSLQDASGNTVLGSQVDYNGQPAGYTLDPQEVITYVSAHDNETLFDAIQLKAPTSTPISDRVRMQNMGLSIVLLSQGVPFIHAGDELLRSKSLDRNSYNSGDWFNRLDFTYQTDNWGVGLPPGDNSGNWSTMKPLLGNSALKPSNADILAAKQNFIEMLSIRKSSPLFRLQTAADIQARLKFYNTGPNQLPGLIVTSIADDIKPGDTGGAISSGLPDIDPKYGMITVLFNASSQAQTFTNPAFVGIPLSLHPIQANSADAVVKTATFDSASGTFTIPARTTAVFVNVTVAPTATPTVTPTLTPTPTLTNTPTATFTPSPTNTLPPTFQPPTNTPQGPTVTPTAVPPTALPTNQPGKIRPKLKLFAECSPAPNLYRVWRVQNKGNAPVTFIWAILGTRQHGVAFVQAHQEMTFQTVTVQSIPNMAAIWVNGELHDLALSEPKKCR